MHTHIRYIPARMCTYTHVRVNAYACSQLEHVHSTNALNVYAFTCECTCECSCSCTCTRTCMCTCPCTCQFTSTCTWTRPHGQGGRQGAPRSCVSLWQRRRLMHMQRRRLMHRDGGSCTCAQDARMLSTCAQEHAHALNLCECTQCVGMHMHMHMQRVRRCWSPSGTSGTSSAQSTLLMTEGVCCAVCVVCV